MSQEVKLRELDAVEVADLRAMADRSPDWLQAQKFHALLDAYQNIGQTFELERKISHLEGAAEDLQSDADEMQEQVNDLETKLEVAQKEIERLYFKHPDERPKVWRLRI